MKSSSARDWAALGCALLGMWGIARLRAPLSEQFRRAEARTDVYTLPAPDQTYVASLGYRSALADLIFGHVLVSYGLHFQEHHRFEFVGEYLDTVVRLDPRFRDPYRFADTLLTLQPEAPPESSYRHAVALQDQGLKEFPDDQELWNTAGQFQAYLAPTYLHDENERLEVRYAGAQKLMRACELIGSNDRVPYHCITAANLLSEQGNLEASREFLERLANTSDDPKIQEIAENNLRRINGIAQAERQKARASRFNAAWKADLAFVPRQEIQALGPRFDPAACAGARHFSTTDCSTSWLSWSASAQDSGAP